MDIAAPASISAAATESVIRSPIAANLAVFDRELPCELDVCLRLIC